MTPPIDRLTPDDIAMMKTATEDMWAEAEKATQGRTPRFGHRPLVNEILTETEIEQERERLKSLSEEARQAVVKAGARLHPRIAALKKSD